YLLILEPRRPGIMGNKRFGNARGPMTDYFPLPDAISENWSQTDIRWVAGIASDISLTIERLYGKGFVPPPDRPAIEFHEPYTDVVALVPMSNFRQSSTSDTLNHSTLDPVIFRNVHICTRLKQ
ncbi:MAG: hypothetical protein Q9224_007116, partial [Gallowayella concinna]